MSWGHEQRLCMLCTVVLIIFIGISAPASASVSFSQPNALTRYYGRQDPPSPFLTAPLPVTFTSTTSFDYWWPYPPASTSPTDGTDTDGSVTSEVTVLPISDTSSSASSSSTSPSTTPTSNTPSNTASSQDSSSTSSSLITITALPPLTSPLHGSHRFSAYRKPLNPLLFAPLFGILGGGIGVACGWYGYGYWKRRQQARNEDRFAGPKYEDVEGEDSDRKYYVDGEKYTHGDSFEVIDEEEVAEESLLYKDARNSSHPHEDAETLDQPVEPKTESAWARVGLSALLRSPLLAGLVNGQRAASPESGDEVKNRKPYSSVKFSAFTNGEESPVEDLRSPYAPTVFSSIATSDEDEEDYENARRVANKRGTVRHKSIRKRLAEKLQLQFSPRRGFGRQKSKENKTRKGTPELEEGILLQDHSDFMDSPATSAKGSSKRKRSKSTASASGHGRTISDFAIPVDVIQTPPRVYALKDPGSGSALQSARTYSTPLKNGSEPGIDDKYTPLPARRSRSANKLVSARSTKRRTEIMEDPDAPPKLSFSTNRRALPTSPPLLSSPQLESELFFSSGAISASHFSDMSRSLTYEQPGNHTRPLYEQDRITHHSPMRRGPSGPRQANKLRSKHSPSTNMDATTSVHSQLRNEAPSPLRRSTARSSSISPTKARHGFRDMGQGRDRSSTLPSVPMLTSPKERYEARRAALDRVDAIVGRSWSARHMQGIAPPTSPTMFGAYADRSYNYGSARKYCEGADSSIISGIDPALGSP